MLANLSIQNYAIIKQLDVQFDDHFCVITGETGAGKSIIMGALSLILGQRADTTVLNNQESKCVVEGRFDQLDHAGLKPFFDDNDLDYDAQVILRREILPNGKSRAFVNDTPVQLNVMRELGLMLIDIHSQHSNLELGKRRFQLKVMDWFAGNEHLLDTYTASYQQYRRLQQDYAETLERSINAKKDLDYLEFQFKQLDEARLQQGEQESLESEQATLSHAEEMKTSLLQTTDLLDGNEFSVLPRLKEAQVLLHRLAAYSDQAHQLEERLNSAYLELKDLAEESAALAEKSEYLPERIQEVTERLNLIFALQQKHHVLSVEELMALRDEMDQQIQAAASYDEELEKLEKAMASVRLSLSKQAAELNKARLAQLPSLQQEITAILQQLGMPNAVFRVSVHPTPDFTAAGTDELIFLFTANLGGKVEEITKVASGGEMSRLMLAIKTVVARSKALPAIVFDEIDSGISGEIALKMGEILAQMAGYMQVINITHLPQIASKAGSHYLVYKKETATETLTGMRKLNSDDRLTEIAKMLSGENPTAGALENARSLLER
ncbi:MAG: DNA repair protein RecN [Prolixibacteraceae bacterium]|nr:DNA repair protein RecN [Prolixibacteraceae bacterium]